MSRNTISKINEFSLIALGLVGAAMGFWDVFFQIPQNVLTKNFESIILILLSFIATTLGFEKISFYDEIKNLVKKIEIKTDDGFDKLEKKIGYDVQLKTWNEIYDSAILMLDSSSSMIRATSCGFGKWTGPERYIKRIARIAREKAENHEFFEYRSVIGCNINENDSESLGHTAFTLIIKHSNST